MFSTDTPPQSRRKDFKAFTDQLINPLQNTRRPHATLVPSKMSHTARPPQDTNSLHPSDQPSLPDTNKLPPSASLILGQTSKVNARLPRPSSSAITLSSVPYSYAYGAAGSPPHLTGKRMPAAQTADTTDSISPCSRDSRGRPSAHPTDDVSVASATSEKNRSEPARVRYARLSQRLQNTGSAHAPSQAIPKVVLPTTSSTLLNDTSVNIASAFERAQLASRMKKVNTQNPSSERPNPPNQNNITNRDQSQLPNPQQPVIIDENGRDNPDTNNESTEIQQNKKRKKGRRSLDPSYKYRPGDSATSDSEAGEGIADKRLRREKKARLEQEKHDAQSTNQKRSVSRRRKRKSAQSTASEDLTDSDEDTGPGIAATRGRMVLKDNQIKDQEERAVSRHRKDNNTSRKKKTADTRTTDSHMDMNTNEEGSEMSFERDQRQSMVLDSDATKNSHPSATFFLSDPKASPPPEEQVPNQSNDRDLTAGTTDSSRLTLRLSGDSYDFAEEERIVKALENQTRQQQPLETSRSNRPATDVTQESSSNSRLSPRDRISSNELTRRSDSGMREIEEIVASNSHSAHPKSAKPRVLPLPNPRQAKGFSPIIEEPEPELAKAPAISLLDGVGTKLANQWNAARSLLLRLNRFTWLALLSSMLLALIINSIRTGDITLSGFLFSPFQKASPTYSAPRAEIHNMEELVERLKSLESAVSSISSEHQSDSKNLQQSLQRDKKEFDYKVGRLELKLEEEEKLRGGLADKVQRKVEQGMQVLRNDLESVIIGHRYDHGQLEKVKETVEGLSGKVATSEYSNSNSVSREDVRVMIDQWSSKARDGNVDPEQLKQTVLKAILKQIKQDGYLTKAHLSKLLEHELHTMAIGFEQQLDSKLQKLRQDIPAPRHRTKNIDSKGEAMDQVQELIEEALERYSQDQIGKRDFALYSGGARVIPQLTSKTYQLSGKNWSEKIISYFTGAPSVLQGRGPVTALSPETGLGMCWPISGSTGQIGIYLSRRILVTEVSVEHVDKSLAFELDSSPRDIEVWSIEDSKKLLDIVYDPFKSSRIQTFQIPKELNYLSGQSNQKQELNGVQTTQEDENSHHSHTDDLPILRQGILFKIKSNHGNPYYTCIYRLRVHGLMESELNSAYN